MAPVEMPWLWLGVRPPTALMLVLTPVSAGPVPLEEWEDVDGAAVVGEDVDEAAVPDSRWPVLEAFVWAAEFDDGSAGSGLMAFGCAVRGEPSAGGGAAAVRTGATPGGVGLLWSPRLNTQPSKPPGVTRWLEAPELLYCHDPPFGAYQYAQYADAGGVLMHCS